MRKDQQKNMCKSKLLEIRFKIENTFREKKKEKDKGKGKFRDKS